MSGATELIDSASDGQLPTGTTTKNLMNPDSSDTIQSTRQHGEFRVRFMCPAGQSVFKNNVEESSCFLLSVEHYVVETRAYDLYFDFHPDDRLQSITLDWDFGSVRLGELEPLPKGRLHLEYEAVFKLLNYKYGEPLAKSRTLSDMNDCFFNNGDRGWSYELCDEWQSGPSNKYEAGQNHITLKLSAYSEDSTVQVGQQTSDDELYHGKISVLYRFTDSTAADKF